ncbi:MAG: arylsulfatase [Saprospiraceae bacterium]|nr:arylsulfatase [Saprospiraceae bacterium]
MVILLLACQPTVWEQDHDKPNIIFIMLDEWGYFESSLMGHPILETPNIDKLAVEGMLFTQFLAGANVCAPTRSVLLTGQHTGHTTVRTNGGGQALRDDDVTLAEMLKDGGYATGGFGKWGLGDVGTSGVPESQGFDVFFGYYHQVHAHTYYPRYLIKDSERIPLAGNTGDIHSGKTFSQYLIHQAGLKFIRDNKDHPFFAYIPWTPPHGHWHMPNDDPAWLKYKDVQWDAANQRGKHDAQIYAAMIEMVDRQIGEIVQLLKELDLYEDTVLFICGDNGGQAYFANDHHPHGFFAPNLNPKTGVRFRGGKRNFYEGGLRIPFIVHWSGRIGEGRISDHLGYFPDVMPTLAEIAGLPHPTTTDGLSILPTLLGESEMNSSQERHKYLYWEDENSVALRMQHWKAIRPTQESDFELYDLNTDLEELNNVVEKFPEILAEMKAFALDAHTPPRYGTVLDSTVRFKGHKAE